MFCVFEKKWTRPSNCHLRQQYLMVAVDTNLLRSKYIYPLSATLFELNLIEMNHLKKNTFIKKCQLCFDTLKYVFFNVGLIHFISFYWMKSFEHVCKILYTMKPFNWFIKEKLYSKYNHATFHFELLVHTFFFFYWINLLSQHNSVRSISLSVYLTIRRDTILVCFHIFACIFANATWFFQSSHFPKRQFTFN